MNKQKSIILSPPIKNNYGDLQTYRKHIIVGPLTLKAPKFIKRTHVELIGTFSAVAETILPKNFDIRDQLSGNLTHVLNQGHCGSCWTFSCATAASDIFTKVQLKKGADINDGVRISPMSFFNLSGKVPVLNGCNGGIPGSALSYMEQNQIPLISERCQDYSWYVASTQTQNINNDSLNKLWSTYTSDNITPSGASKCFEKPLDGDNHQFFIKNVNTSHISGIDPQDLMTDLSGFLQTAIGNQTVIKKHLMSYGSVVCGIPIFTGFMSGGENLATNGQNLDTSSWVVADHNNNLVDGNVYVQSNTDVSHEGGHAVTIVGWGNNSAVANRARIMLTSKYGNKVNVIEKILKSLGGDLGNYWIIRNSWGYEWSNGDPTNPKLAGYFCLAMYPSNIHVQLSYPYQSSNLFSLYTTFEPDIVCSSNCKNKLLANEPTKLFNDLSHISDPTNQYKDWSGYLANGKKYYQETNINYKEYTSPPVSSNIFTKYWPYIVGVIITIIIILTTIL